LHHPYFYKYFHKKHHKFQHPIAITTFYQDPVDLLITNSFPTMMTLLLLSPMVSISHFQFHMILVYKTFLEIGGHIGKHAYPSSSFPQCKWLPQWLCIELYTEDHDYHHSHNHCNYGKRFSLWDKVFGTYVHSIKNI
jgi:sterol desaturase/sphingolipid hydroxylase (fatty acid hydroxylase superfamily)